MIFVTVGTTPFPFLRMRELVLALVANGKSRKHIIFQHGATPPVHMNAIENSYSMSFSQVCRCISRASIVICHGGPATIFQSLGAGKIPYVLPRRHEFKEHVDNHQVYFTDFMILAHRALSVPPHPSDIRPHRYFSGPEDSGAIGKYVEYLNRITD